MGSDICYIDFEFNRIVEPNVNLVSCSTYVEKTKEKRKFWLHNSPKNQAILYKYLKQFELIIGYSCVAEARSFLALNLDPLQFKWIDLFLEYRMISNHNDRLQWGKQLVNGQVKTFKKPKPKWERDEEESAAGFKPTHSLAEATYKLTGKIRDTQEKTEARELIISNPKSYTEVERQRIMDYNMEDVVFLPEIWRAIKKEFRVMAPEVEIEDYYIEAIDRGRYSAHTAIMEATGYPINIEATRNFSKQIPFILMECQRDINAQFPKIKPFRWDKKRCVFTWNQNTTRKWVTDNHNIEKWVRTDTGKLSLALEAFEKFYQFKHDYPVGNFGAQMVRFLKLKQSLYGFSDSGGKRKNFWDSVGSDGRVRPYMNIYGAQSGRSQPAASGFMFLKPAWMRSLVQPAPGKFICGIDYGQQEFFLSALESNDKNMIDAYLSGDPYLFGAKLAGVIPQDGTKEEYKQVRDVFKNTYLGILFGMTKYGLAIKLSNDTGEEYTEEMAQDQIDLFEESFETYMDWKKELMEDYDDGCGIRLPCVSLGTLIYTDLGIKKIEDVKLEDKIWDGEKWVKHGGVLPRGKKDAIYIKKIDLKSTPDHWILHEGIWLTAVEVRLGVERGLGQQKSEKFLADGRRSLPKQESKAVVLSYVAAYVALKNSFESRILKLGMLEPVLNVLNLSVPEGLDITAMSKFLMTNIFIENGGLVTIMPKTAVKKFIMGTTKITAVAGFNSNSTPLENSWDTLLRSMGIKIGAGLWTELIMTEAMSLGIYELLAKERTIKTEVFDIKNCGPDNRYQSSKAISHNCGWRMGPDNDNIRSVCNVPIQGFGGSIMRRAVDLAASRGVRVILTLHDALYFEGDVGKEKMILILYESMSEAFQYYFQDDKRLYEIAGKIKLDPFAWSSNYKKDSSLKVGDLIVPCSNMYIDERATNEFLRFSKYFSAPDSALI